MNKSKLLIICALLVSVNAGYLGNNYNSLGGYSAGGSSKLYEQHVPVIHNGVPVETPEVQAAKAQHFAAFAKASAQSSHYSDTGDYEEKYQVVPVQQQNNYYLPQSGHHHQSTTVWPSNTIPQDTPEVAAAKYAHLSALQKANSLESSNYHSYNNDDIHNTDLSTNQYSHNIGPVDTPEVQHAKAIHLAALAQATSKNSHHYRYRRGIYAPQHYSTPQHFPVITKDGVPLETPEVQQAKAQHLLAHANAKVPSYGHQSQGWDGGNYAHANQVNYAVNHVGFGGWQKYQGPQHVPVLGKNGVPIDTPEVQVARQQHLLAHAKAKIGELEWQQGNAGGWQEENVGGWQQEQDNLGWQQEGLGGWQQQNIGGYGGQYAGASSYGGHYDHHVPIIGPNGVPQETPEVQIAKAQHLAAHAQEKAKHSQWQVESGYGGGYDDYSTGNAHSGGSYAYGTIAGYLGDSKHDTTVLNSGHSQITKTSNHVNHESSLHQHY